MTIRGRLITLFPALLLGLCFLGLALALESGDWRWLAGVAGFIYLFPPLCFRLHDHFCAVEEGLRHLDDPNYSAWWGSLQFQGIYNAAPALEALLRLIPGCYSAWLRLWGSRIGRRVNWTPRVEISDRSLLDIGDRVTFGHRVALYPHVVERRKGRLVLYVKRICIGEDAFIGAGCRLGPGAVIEAGYELPMLTDISVDQRVTTDRS